jgi:hypothetical protein
MTEDMLGALADRVGAVVDPEIPVLTIADLGVLRDVRVGDDGRVVVDPSMHPDHSPIDEVRPDSERLVLQRHWEGAQMVPIPAGIGSHGGGDAYLLDHLFHRVAVDEPLGRVAGYLDGVKAVSVGIAGNVSLATGEPVRIADLELGI